MVITVDRGRWGCVLNRDPHCTVTAMRARELGRTPIVVGDQVDVVGDLSGRPDTLARIVRRSDRRTVLRRTADDTDPTERVVVANADLMMVVVALADPPPRIWTTPGVSLNRGFWAAIVATWAAVLATRAGPPRW